MDKALELYQSSGARQEKLWVLYHNWYDIHFRNRAQDQRLVDKIMFQSMFKDYPRILKNGISRSEIYKEIRRYTAYKYSHWKEYLVQQRFETFSLLFYNKTKVDIEFGRHLICSFIR